MPERVANIAILGAGYWGINLIRNFAQLEGCRVVLVCEPNRSRWGKIRALCPAARIETDHETAFADDGVEAVVVATPVVTHYALAAAALQAGRHAFVEKPLALTGKQCRDLIALAEARDRRLMVGHTFEYNPAVRKAKQLIAAGELGNIYYLYSQRLNLGIVQPDVSALWSLAPHDVSTIRYLLGREPDAVTARGYAYVQDAIEDVVFVDLEFPGRTAAHIHVSWLDPGKVRRMTIVGDRKMLVYDDVNIDARIQIYDKGITRASLGTSLGEWSSFGEFQLIQRAGDVVIPKIEAAEPLAIECRHFVDCVLTGARPQTDGENGYRVVRVLEAAETSMNEGRRVLLDELTSAL
jgi:predicted dehydrogenase